jgi:geranylgeranyl pyrophosphate synthase
MQLCSEKKDGKDYTKLVNILGTHFQIRDDYMNLMSDKVSLNILF